jgi:asparaginyl-tRNA synthetase
MTDEGDIDYKDDMFSKKVGLTVSGQIHVEPFAQSHRNVYTFGPTMRAEKSNTKIHANEFWMIEPEMSFCDLAGDIEYIEGLVKYIIDHVLKTCPEEMKFFNQFVEKGLIERLEKVLKADFKKVTHKEAVDVLLASNQKFEFLPKQGEDLATEHEKYLTEVYGPVFITDWPKDIKAFYMTVNDDNETVAAVDLLVPGSGELVGGSQREHRPEVLEKRMIECGVDVEELKWYLDLRRYSGTMTSGFGIGLERMIMFVTGIDNIRDTQAYPRTPRNCEL